MPERKRKAPTLSSVIGWAIFVLAIAGGPVLRGVQSAFGGMVQLTNLLPYVIGGLVLLSFVASALRALGNRDARMPERAGQTGSPASMQPMPPFGGELSVPQLPPVYRDLTTAQPARLDVTAASEAFASSFSARASGEYTLSRPPRFEPIVSPTLIVFGVIGALVLGGAALLVFSLSLP